MKIEKNKVLYKVPSIQLTGMNIEPTRNGRKLLNRDSKGIT